ncbi:unnamed protein product, partial [Effrenium voratum]
RAMTAWHVVRRQEVTARRMKKATGLRRSHLVFQVWVMQWQHERKEALLLRRSLQLHRKFCYLRAFQAWVAQHRRNRKERGLQRLTLFPRKQGLKQGIRALHRNVQLHHRECALAKVQQGTRQADRRLLEVCWAALQRHLEQRQLMILYLSWADENRLRARLGAAFQAWLAWRHKRKVVAMSNAAQLWAAWRWLRHRRRCQPGHDTRLGLKQPTSLAPVPAPWWHAAATELLFGSAPFAAHPHHMKAMREGLLVVFASTLLKKMMEAWMREARAMREMLQQAKLKAKQRSLGAWKEGIAKCLRLRSKSLQVSNRRQSQVQVRALEHWQHRWSARTQHRRQLRDFDV